MVATVLCAQFCLQAVDSRDSVAMALYSQCFSWIIMKINQKIKGKENFKSIGILDIFGFENFEVLTSLFFNLSTQSQVVLICFLYKEINITSNQSFLDTVQSLFALWQISLLAGVQKCNCDQLFLQRFCVFWSNRTDFPPFYSFARRWTGLNSLTSTTPTKNSRSISISTSSLWNSWSTTGGGLCV